MNWIIEPGKSFLDINPILDSICESHSGTCTCTGGLKICDPGALVKTKYDG